MLDNTKTSENTAATEQTINILADLAGDSIRAKRVYDYTRANKRPITGPSGADWAYVARKTDLVLRGTDSLGVEQYRHHDGAYELRAYSEAGRAVGESPHHEEELSAREFRDYVNQRALLVRPADEWDVDLRDVYQQDKEQRWEGDELITDGGRSKCIECGAYLPDEPEPDTGVYCAACGTGQLLTDGGRIMQPHPANDLTLFQVNILAVLAEDADYGLGIKDSLEEFYGKEVNHGRLYPNLDTLVNKGLLAKSKLDRRTNEYELTDVGRDVLDEYRTFLAYERGADDE